jgi:segregation and condensation protein B
VRNEDLKLIEVLLFATPEPLTQQKLNLALNGEFEIHLKSAVDALNLQYQKDEKGLYIDEIAGGFQILTYEKYYEYIQRLYKGIKKIKLSRPALETLSIIAYRQPISKADVEGIRGVECGSVLKTLIERELITIKGRGEGLGRPLLYGTTQLFLESYGLNSVKDLPKLKELNQLIQT